MTIPLFFKHQCTISYPAPPAAEEYLNTKYIKTFRIQNYLNKGWKQDGYKLFDSLFDKLKGNIWVF